MLSIPNIRNISTPNKDVKYFFKFFYIFLSSQKSAENIILDKHIPFF